MANGIRLGDVPTLPKPPTGGSIASDIASSIAAFLQGLRERKAEEERKAMEQALFALREREADLASRRLAQEAQEGAAERRFRRDILQQQLEAQSRLAEAQANARRQLEELRAQYERDRVILEHLLRASESGTISPEDVRRVREEFNKQLKHRGEEKKANITSQVMRGLNPPGGLEIVDSPEAVPPLAREDSIIAAQRTARSMPELQQATSAYFESLLGKGVDLSGEIKLPEKEFEKEAAQYSSIDLEQRRQDVLGLLKMLEYLPPDVVVRNAERGAKTDLERLRFRKAFEIATQLINIKDKKERDKRLNELLVAGKSLRF